MVATNSQSRCREQGIPFYRFSPKLRDVIAGSETDNEKLFNMVIQTRIDTREQGMEELVRLFHTIAGASHHLAPRIEEEETAFERENHHKNEHCQQESAAQREPAEVNANLGDQRGLLQVPPPTSSSQPVLSDIEESVEASSKKSYKLPSLPRQPSALATFVVGDEAQDTGRVSAGTAAATAASGDGESVEKDSPSEQDVGRSESTSANVLGGGMGASDQSTAKRESKSQTREESPQNETDVTLSQNSSVFSSEFVSPNESEISSPQENADDDKGLVNAESRVSPPHADNQQPKDMNTEAVTSPLEPPPPTPSDHAVPSLVKLEIEGKAKSQDVSKEPITHPTEAIHDQTTTPEASQESEEEQTRKPSGQVTSDEPVERHANLDRPPSTPSQQDSEFPSQQTLEENTVDDASSIATTAHEPPSVTAREQPSFSSEQEGSSATHDLVVITSEKFAGEEREEVWSHQMKQEGLEERPNSALNGDSVVRVAIPTGSSHSSFISLESPRIDGPPKKMARTVNDKREIPNGEVHCGPSTTPSTDTEQHSIEIQSNIGLVNGCKSHTQLENATIRHEEVPNHYKLDIQLTPKTQQDAQSKFPYRFETEI